jgi:hypothetical protein
MRNMDIHRISQITDPSTISKTLAKEFAGAHFGEGH